MRDRKIIALGLVVALAQVGCWTTGTNLDTGRSLRGPERKSRPDVRVVVTTFLRLERQAFDHKTVGNLHTWKEAAGVRDVGREIARGLTKAGFDDVSYQPDAAGEYYVEGYIERFRRGRAAGSVLWGSFGGLLTPLYMCIVPLYFRSPTFKTQVVVSVSDYRGERLLTRKIPLEYVAHSTCPWGAFTLDDGFVVKTVANEVVNVLEEAIARGGTAPAGQGVM